MAFSILLQAPDCDHPIVLCNETATVLKWKRTCPDNAAGNIRIIRGDFHINIDKAVASLQVFFQKNRYDGMWYIMCAIQRM